MFSGPNAIGVEHRELFNPMPLTTVAFVLAIMQFCAEEYETGHFRLHDLSMTDMLNKYVAHLRGLKEARTAAKCRMARLQQCWFDFGYEYSGAIPIDQPYFQAITLRSDMRPDTPKPETEIESNDEGIAFRNGKGRAYY